jgi:hypothetical protein
MVCVIEPLQVLSQVSQRERRVSKFVEVLSVDNFILNAVILPPVKHAGVVNLYQRLRKELPPQDGLGIVGSLTPEVVRFVAVTQVIVLAPVE